MSQLGDLLQTADWKSEKHVPVIECPEAVAADTPFEVKVSLGKEVDHPNTTAHHIRWIQLFFHPEGDKVPYQVGNFEFSAHGESAEGADQGPVYTHHCATLNMQVRKPGTLLAMSFCNIHGLWENTRPLGLK
jgi:superoxide reductase